MTAHSSTRKQAQKLLVYAFVVTSIGSAISGCARKGGIVSTKPEAGALSTLSPSNLGSETPTQQNWKESVLESPRVSSDITVTNGVSFERGEFSASGVTELVVPENAPLVESIEADTVTVEVVKGLRFFGVPPAPMRIALARRYLGVATRTEGYRLHLATYGEWQNKEGGATMRLTVHVPVAIQVVGVSGYRGPTSVGQGELKNQKMKAPLTECYWYGPTEPAQGWSSIALRPDGAKARAKDGPVL